VPAPQLSLRRPDATTAAFEDARMSYYMNRGRGMGIENVLGREALTF
jgi:hypothetical protein